jgi:hypothetical protein
MTSVMRALGAPATPRVLRIGLVREGRIREERVLEKHASVSVGRDEGATFVVDDVVARVAVIERDLGAYFLNLRAPIAGRVEIEGAVHEIAALRQASGHRIRLDESSRGRIAVGGATLLFQFVPAPPHAQKPQLPLAVRQGVALDAGLLVIAAFSLLLHFGVVGAMYSDWSDPIVDDAITVGALLDLGHRDLVWTDPAPHSADPATKREAPSHDAAPHDAHGSRRASPTPHAPPGASHFDALAREAQAMSMGILTATHAGSAVAAALARDLPPVDLTDAAKQAGGVTNAGDDLHLTANAFVAPTGHGLDRIAGGAVNDSGAHAHAVDVKPPPVVTTFEPPSSSAPMPKAEQVIARLRGQIRRCYERGLAVDPSMAGSLVVRAKVSANGEVDHAVAASVVGLSSDVAACIVRTIAGATFDPTPSGSTLDVPVKMVQQSH